MLKMFNPQKNTSRKCFSHSSVHQKKLLYCCCSNTYQCFAKGSCILTVITGKAQVELITIQMFYLGVSASYTVKLTCTIPGTPRNFKNGKHFKYHSGWSGYDCIHFSVQIMRKSDQIQYKYTQ